MEKFIGPLKVESVVVTRETSFLGTPVVEVTYTTGKKEIMTQTTYDLVVSEEARDYNAVRDLQFKAFKKEITPLIGNYLANKVDGEEDKDRPLVIEKALILAAEHSLKQRDIDGAFNEVSGEISLLFKDIGETVDLTYDRVTHYFWTQNDKAFVYGIAPITEVTLLQTKKHIEEIIKNDSPKEGGDN